MPPVSSPPPSRRCPRPASASAARPSNTRSSQIPKPSPRPRAKSWSFWLASISPENAAQDLLAHCLRGAPWPEDLLSTLLSGGDGHLLFRIVAERLADLFEPRLCDVYADLFSEVIARVTGEFHADHLRDRYERIRRPK